MKKAVIFDMDGVISDTQELHAEIESKLLEKHGVHVRPSEITMQCAGMNLAELFTHYLNLHDKKADVPALVREKWSLMFEETKDNVRPIPGAMDIISLVRSLGFSTAVASGSKREFITLVLEELNLTDQFDTIVSSEDVTRGKPAPDVFLLAAEKLGVDPKDCIVIEDAVNGMLAAKSAGMKCIGLVPDVTSRYPAQKIVTDLRMLSRYDFEA